MQNLSPNSVSHVPKYSHQTLALSLLLGNCDDGISHGVRGLVEIESSLSISPASMASVIAVGLLPSTWHPTLKAVPRISFTVPSSDLEKDLWRIVRAISIISSSETDLLCLMFFSFLRSLGGSFRARMTRDEAVGTTETAACRFWMVSLTVTRRPFCKLSPSVYWQFIHGSMCARSPSRPWPWQCLRQLSWEKDLEVQSWEPVKTRHQPHHPWHGGGYNKSSQRISKELYSSVEKRRGVAYMTFTSLGSNLGAEPGRRLAEVALEELNAQYSRIVAVFGR